LKTVGFEIVMKSLCFGARQY